MMHMDLKMPGRRAAGRCAAAHRPDRHQEVRCRSGQAAVEYLLTTLFLVTCFAGMYGFMQQQLTTLFVSGGKLILTTYK
jgi:hypothetical protein